MFDPVHCDDPIQHLIAVLLIAALIPLLVYTIKRSA